MHGGRPWGGVQGFEPAQRVERALAVGIGTGASTATRSPCRLRRVSCVKRWRFLRKPWGRRGAPH